MIKKVAYTIILLLFGFSGFTQETANKNLLTLSLVEEPIVLQRKRLQGNIDYQFGMYSKYFDAQGQKSKIIDEGLVSSMNQLSYSVNYGLFDWLQIGILHNYCSGFEGEETITKLYYNETYNYTYIKEIKGFSDVLFNIGYLLPINGRKIEIAIFPGIYFPMDHDPLEPIYDVSTIEDEEWTNIDYTSNEKIGTGAFRFEIATTAKLRFKQRIALLLNGKYNMPFNSVNSISWESVFDGENYQVSKNKIKYSPPHEIYGNIECQIVPDKREIMGIKLGANLNVNLNEWIESENIKTAQPNAMFFRTYTELELIISEHIRFNQQFGYDLTGRNTKGAFISQTLFTFNCFTK